MTSPDLTLWWEHLLCQRPTMIRNAVEFDTEIEGADLWLHHRLRCLGSARPAETFRLDFPELHRPNAPLCKILFLDGLVRVGLSVTNGVNLGVHITISEVMEDLSEDPLMNEIEASGETPPDENSVDVQVYSLLGRQVMRIILAPPEGDFSGSNHNLGHQAPDVRHLLAKDHA